MDIDWRLAGNGNPFASFAEGLESGQALKQDRQRTALYERRQAFDEQQERRKQELAEQARRRQEAVGAALTKNDYAGARVAAGGDLDLLKSIGEMDDQRRKQMAEVNAYAARQLYTLRGLPPEEAARRWQTIVPSIVQRGAKAEELAIDFNDPTAIDRELAESMTLSEMIAQAEKDKAAKKPIEVSAGATLAVPDGQGGYRSAFTAPKQFAPQRSGGGGGGGVARPSASAINPNQVKWD